MCQKSSGTVVLVTRRRMLRRIFDVWLTSVAVIGGLCMRQKLFAALLGVEQRAG